LLCQFVLGWVSCWSSYVEEKGTMKNGSIVVVNKGVQYFEGKKVLLLFLMVVEYSLKLMALAIH